MKISASPQMTWRRSAVITLEIMATYRNATFVRITRGSRAMIQP
jgi:hypothetical protein